MIVCTIAQVSGLYPLRGIVSCLARLFFMEVVGGWDRKVVFRFLQEFVYGSC